MSSLRDGYIIGFDSGTQSVKTIVFNKIGNIIGEGKSSHSTSIPRPNWAEQDPNEWWSAFLRSIKIALKNANASPDQVDIVGITHQRETICAIDKDGNPVIPAQVWYDARALDEVRWIKEEYGSEKYMEISGRMPDTTWWAQKAMWIKNNMSEIFDSIHKLLTVHGYFVYKLTGELKDTYAAPTGLLDIKNFNYSNQLLDDFEIPREKLCDLIAPGEIIGYVTKEASSETGLPAGLPISSGAGDQQAGGLGCEVVEVGTSYLNLGTSVVLGTLTKDYIFHKNFFTRAGCIPGTWNPESIINGGYWMITWFKKNFAKTEIEAADSCGITAEEILESEAIKIPAGSQGLILQPYWLGVRQPYWDENAKGIIIGWTGNHTKAHLYRSIIEGIAYDVRLNFDRMEEALGSAIEDVRIHGGGANSDLSCQIMSDITNKPVYRMHTQEATALGAAILATVANRDYRSVKEAATLMTHIAREFKPMRKNRAIYEKYYKNVYENLYPSNMKLMKNISALDSIYDATG